MRVFAAVSLLLLALLLSSLGCSSVRGSAVRTGPLNLQARNGPVAIYVAEPPPAGHDLGVVEVRGDGPEAIVEKLLPAFAAKAASLGGNAAVVEDVEARFEMVYRMQIDSYSYPCGYYVCFGTRNMPYQEQVMVLTMRGRSRLIDPNLVGRGEGIR